MRMVRSFRTISLTHVYHRNLRRFINTVPSAPFLKKKCSHGEKKVFRGVPRAYSLFGKKSWNNNGKLIHLEEIDNKIYTSYLVTTVDSQGFSVHETCLETVLVEGWRGWDACIPHMEVTGCCLLYRCQPPSFTGQGEL